MAIIRFARFAVLAAFFLISLHAVSQSIQNTGKLNFPRSFHQSQLLPDGKVLAFGGWDNIFKSPTVHASAELYDPAVQTWTVTGSMSQARVFFASVVLPNGNILATGGDPDGDLNALASCEIFDIQTKTWKPAASMNIARRNHRAIRLRDGNILVVGGTDDTRCELYDPITDTWSFTGRVNVARGGIDGVSLAMINGGAVLMTGGSSGTASYSGEIYIPALGRWTLIEASMIYPRADHNSVVLSNGNVLLVGSSATASNGANWSEVFNVTTQTFERRAFHPAGIGKNNPAIPLDDGNVLAHTQGNYAINTQAFQVYNTTGNYWTPLMATNFFGNNAYTLHKLYDGSILIAGGYISIDLGATKDCLLVREAGVAVCNTRLDLELSDNIFCYGNDGKVVVSQSESGATYQAYMGSMAVGTAVNGGGDIELTIPATFIASGINRVTVKVSKSGCVSKFLSDVAILNAQQAELSKPVITNLKPLKYCPGDNTVLQAPAGFSRYLWSNGATTSEITVTTIQGTYSVKVFNGAGCSSPASDPVQVSIYPSVISAGDDETVCVTVEKFRLSGYSPEDGIWSGNGVTTTGEFDPAQAGVGTHTLVYTLCGRIDIKTITVKPKPVIPDFTFQWSEQKICENGSTTLYVKNVQGGVSYQLHTGTQNIGGAQTPSSNLLTFYIGTRTDTTRVFTVTATWYTDCGLVVTREKSETLQVVRNPRPVAAKALKDSVCFGEQTQVRITRSVPGIAYFLRKKSNGSILETSVMGNDADIMIPTEKLESSETYWLMGKNELSCGGLVKLNELYIYMKPLTIDFAPGLPGDFIGDTVRLINRSNASSYKWKFNPPASIATSTNKDPGFITYSSGGKKSIRLIGTSSIGCVDSLTKEIDIVESIDAGVYASCFESETSATGSVLDYHVDKNGNSYMTGHKSYRMFCAKVDNTGKMIWSREEEYSYQSFGTGITSDNEGNTYVVGQAMGRDFKFGKLTWYYNEQSSNMGAWFMYVVKLNPAGEEQWLIVGSVTDTEHYTTTKWIVASDIASDKDNRIYVAGHQCLWQAQIAFPDGTIKALPQTQGVSRGECFILEIDGAGTMKDYVEFGSGSKYNLHTLTSGSSINGWINVGSSSRVDVAVNPKIKIDHDGDVLVGGVFEGMTKDEYPYKFGDIHLYPLKDADPGQPGLTHFNGSTFVAEYNKTQGWKSAVRGVSLGVYYLQEFAKDKDGSIYTVGGLTSQSVILGDTITIDPAPSTTYDKPKHSYLAKSNPHGDLEWYAVNETAYFHDVEVSDHHTVIVTGDLDAFGSLRDAGGRSFGIQATAKQDVFIGEYSGEGDVLWAKPLGTAAADMPFFTEVTSCNTVYVSSGTNSGISYWPMGSSATLKVSKLARFGNCTTTACEPQPLSLTGFDPEEGTGGDHVNITGTNFAYVSQVAFNGVDAAFTAVSDDHIIATVPASATTGKISLSTYNESVSSTDNFAIDRLKFVDFTPSHGVEGTVVTVYARHIHKVQAVKFNGVEAAAFVVVNDTTLQVAVPQHAATGFITLAGEEETVSSKETFQVDIPTGNETEMLAKCGVYPNPTSGAITLDCINMGSAFYVEVFTMLGIRVAEQWIEGASQKSTVDLKHVPAGLYNVLLYNGTKREAYLLVKE